MTPATSRRRAGTPVPPSAGYADETGAMRILRYAVIAVLAVALLVTGVGWYLAAHPGGTRFESCHWQGSTLVLGYTYGTGDTVHAMVNPRTDDIVAQLRVDEAGGNHTTQVLTGQARFQVSGGPRTVHYPSGAELNCPTR